MKKNVILWLHGGSKHNSDRSFLYHKIVITYRPTYTLQQLFAAKEKNVKPTEMHFLYSQKYFSI